MITFYILGYIFLAGFFAMEYSVRSKGKDTKGMDRKESDKGSTIFVSMAIATGIILVIYAPVGNYFGICAFYNIEVSIIGIILAIFGFFIRFFALSTLGKFFTRTLREVEEHKLVTNGIYKRLRHPGYLANILLFIGMSLMMQNGLAIITILILFISAYSYRIHVEEKMLIGIFGEEYLEYQKRSKKLLPFVY